MASFFGEIIEPTTRAIFHEFSDEEDNAEEPELKLLWIQSDKKLPSVFDVIFIIQGRLSLAFAEICLLDENSSVAAEIYLKRNDPNPDSEIENYKEKILPSRIYIEENIAFCLVSPSFSADLGYSFSNAISSLLKVAKKVIVLTNDSIYNYKTHSLHELPPAFIKELKTSHGLQQNMAEPVETPNFITGIPAEIISWCQIFKKEASAFICYTDQPKLDSITASPYISVLKNLDQNVIKNENPNINRKTFYGKPGVICGSSNIYM